MSESFSFNKSKNNNCCSANSLVGGGVGPPGPIGPPGLDGSMNATTSTSFMFSRLLPGSADNWSNASVPYTWEGATQISGGDPHPLLPTSAPFNGDIDQFLWLSLPQSFSINIIHEPINSANTVGTGNIVDITGVSGASDPAWYVMPKNGIIRGYSINSFIPLDNSNNPIENIPIFCAIATHNGSNYDYTLTGCLLTSNSNANQGGFESFSIQSATTSNRTEFLAGDLLVCGIGPGVTYDGSNWSSTNRYPINTPINITVYVKFD